MKEKSHSEVRRRKTELYGPEDINVMNEESKNSKTKDPKDMMVMQKVSDMDGNNSKMDINTIDSRENQNELKIENSLTAVQFYEEINNLEIQSQCKISQMKLESAESLEKSDMEFREKLAKDEEESEKELRELDRKIEEFERETKRMKEEQVLEIRKMNMAFFQCLLIQKKWEMDEKEFSKFLDSIREPISRLKTRYSLFEKVLKAQRRVKRDVLKRELTSLHGSTYHAYQSVYEGWENRNVVSMDARSINPPESQNNRNGAPIPEISVPEASRSS
ncbi:hypothetical protein L5515_015808 [Caenorhabditis briggsae]|uniref:Uncharacterized protein n=1 Tax=Caenorhabditis briggsae TaxID=6238 RepID=A0AAE9EGU4_CAEBR|nr:hypothetical protein L5515_015808 [Caenorhabditis briggsae]